MVDTVPNDWLFLGFNWNIDAMSIKRLLDLLEVARGNVPGVTIILNSLGGSPEQALYAASIIEGFNHPVYTHNVSSVQSAANLLFLAGHKRFADPNATFMFHKTLYDAGSAGHTMTKEQLALLIEGINNSDAITAKKLAERSGRPIEDFAALMNGDRLCTAFEAKVLGFVDEICPLQMPSESRFVQVTSAP